jgi:SMP-30/Gluconolactonase/LRE-like region
MMLASCTKIDLIKRQTPTHSRIPDNFSHGNITMSLRAASFFLGLMASSGRAAAVACDVQAQGTSMDPRSQVYEHCEFFVMDPMFSRMLDGQSSPSIELLMTDGEAIFHEGPVLFENDALYFSTNRLGNVGEPTWGEAACPLQLDQHIKIIKLDLSTNELSTITPNPPIPMANGMKLSPDGKNILVLSQGFNTTGGGIFQLNSETLESTPIVTGFYGRSFNSLNDIAITSDGDLAFITDPAYGFEQGFRAGVPELGSNVYRYDMATKALSLITTDFQRPNGIALFDDRTSGNGCTLFITDSGFEGKAQLSRGFSGHGDSALYSLKDGGGGCFDPSDGPWPAQALVSVTTGIQDGVLVHTASKLLLYCDGDGLWIHDILASKNIGLLAQPCTQVIFLQDRTGIQKVYILSETKLYSVDLNFEIARRRVARRASSGLRGTRIEE